MLDRAARDTRRRDAKPYRWACCQALKVAATPVARSHASLVSRIACKHLTPVSLEQRGNTRAAGSLIHRGSKRMHDGPGRQKLTAVRPAASGRRSGRAARVLWATLIVEAGNGLLLLCFGDPGVVRTPCGECEGGHSSRGKSGHLSCGLFRGVVPAKAGTRACGGAAR